MKKLFFLTFGSLLIWGCNNTTNASEEKTEVAEVSEQSQPSYNYYGDTISPDDAVKSTDLMAMMEGKDSVAVKVKGTINSSCKRKGCWMKMDMGDGKEMRVSFKDYGFFVPKNLNGETAIIEGYATYDTTTVAQLRHFADDAGKSKEEIEAIKEPKIGVSYVATGVLIEPKS